VSSRATRHAANNSAATAHRFVRIHPPYDFLDRALERPFGFCRSHGYRVIVAREPPLSTTELRRGDQLVIAPEPHAVEAGLVAVRRARTIDLCEISVDAFGQAQLKSSDPETLPWPCTAASVLGTVVAAIRHTHSDVLIGFPPRYDFRPLPPEAPRTRLAPSQIEALSAEIAELSQSAASADHLYPAEARMLRSAAARIATLAKCLEVIHDDRLYAAIIDQISKTNRALRRVLASRPQWALLRSHLRDFGP
jgi:hypothetical protein